MISRLHPDFRRALERLPAEVRERARDEIVWFFIGAHAEYDGLLRNLR